MLSSSSSKNHSTAKKRKNSSPVNLLYLPDDLLLNCLARISRFSYPRLSLVSKKFRSLLASKELYQTRTLLGRTESCLYFLIDSNPRWFILNQRPTRILNPNPNPNESCENVMVASPTHVCFPTDWWDIVAVGSNIYMIGGYNGYAPSTSVFFLDPSHIWHEAPSMLVARKFPKVTVLDEKIYVAGGLEDYDSSNWIECFDPKTRKWEHLPIPDADILERYVYKSLAMEGNLCLFVENKIVVYKPKEDKWDEIIGWEMFRDNGFYSSICVIDNVLYRGYSGIPQWYDFERRSWIVLKGLENLPQSRSPSKLVNYGGKMAVLWESYEHANKRKIWYAEISLEKRNEQEIYGKIDRCDVVMRRVPKSFCIEKFVVVTI